MSALQFWLKNNYNAKMHHFYNYNVSLQQQFLSFNKNLRQPSHLHSSVDDPISPSSYDDYLTQPEFEGQISMTRIRCLEFSIPQPEFDDQNLMTRVLWSEFDGQNLMARFRQPQFDDQNSMTKIWWLEFDHQ